LNVTLSRSEIAEIGDDTSLLQSALHGKFNTKIAEASSQVNENELKKRFQIEYAKLKEAIDERNVIDILKLMPGKIFVGELLKFTGCKNPENLARAMTRHIAINEIAILTSFSASVRRKLGL
jgi:hypothetical protein